MGAKKKEEERKVQLDLENKINEERKAEEQLLAETTNLLKQQLKNMPKQKKVAGFVDHEDISFQEKQKRLHEEKEKKYYAKLAAERKFEENQKRLHEEKEKWKEEQERLHEEKELKYAAQMAEKEEKNM